MARRRIHATCVLVGEAGILIRGPSGSGKSSAASELLADAASAGRFTRLVGDDRVEIEAMNGRLIARAVAPIEGQLEVRGLGIVMAEYEPAALVRLVVECGGAAPERMPQAVESVEKIDGVPLPCLRFGRGSRLLQAIAWRLHAFATPE